MIGYFDASAFVKLLVEEDGSDLAANLWEGCDAVASSRLAYPEVRAALAAAGRHHYLNEQVVASAEEAWELYWAATRPVELTQGVASRAGSLASAHGLVGADAVHLASALALKEAEVVVVVWDRRLHAGAVAVDLGVAPSHLA